MKALVYKGPGAKALEEHAKPVIIEPSDAIVRITHTTICGTDLHILKGDVPSCAPGRILGHEGVGIIESVGAGVTAFKHASEQATRDSHHRKDVELDHHGRPRGDCRLRSKAVI